MTLDDDRDAAAEGALDQPRADSVTGDEAARPRSARFMAAQILVAVSLAGAAVGVHWWLNVPDKILESPRDQGAKKKANKKKPRKQRAKAEARTDEQFEQDWRRYGSVPFDEEPVRAVWARRQQALVNRAVVMARRHAFEGAPEKPQVVLAETKCRSVRCRFRLRSPYRHELDTILGSLTQLRTGDGQEVWRSFESTPVPSAEGAEGEGAESLLEVTVGMRAVKTDSRGLSVPDPEGESGGASPEPPRPNAEAVAAPAGSPPV